MKRPRMFAWVAVVVLLSSLLFLATPALADNNGLVIREIKITGDEFIVLVNDGPDIDNLGNYWLGYTGSDIAIAPPILQLPSVELRSGEVVLLSGGGTIRTCDASTVSELSPSLSDTKGSVQLWHQTTEGFSMLNYSGSDVEWSKSTSSSTVPAGELDIKNETSQYASAVWYFEGTDWVLTDMDGCSLIYYSSSTDVSGNLAVSWPENNQTPPAIIESLAGSSTPVDTLPSADIGLKAPQITELLPNPTGSGTDDTDEFIELYNPNNAAFDLSGFVLETGLATKHKYTFDSGVSIAPKSFTAIYSADTGLTLSNTSSQANLLDPLGNMVSQSDVYSSAKDGLAWALANGHWYWTNKPTPGSANIVSQGTASSMSKNKKPSTSSGTVKGASTGIATNASSGFDNSAAPTPIHPWTLAGVGAAALLYAGYEYKADLANNLYRLRRYYAARRAAGK